MGLTVNEVHSTLYFQVRSILDLDVVPYENLVKKNTKQWWKILTPDLFLHLISFMQHEYGDHITKDMMMHVIPTDQRKTLKNFLLHASMAIVRASIKPKPKPPLRDLPTGPIPAGLETSVQVQWILRKAKEDLALILGVNKDQITITLTI